jgi:hypothetical protein
MTDIRFNFIRLFCGGLVGIGGTARPPPATSPIHTPLLPQE